VKNYRRRIRGLLSLVGIIALTLFVYSYMKESEKKIDYPEYLYGIPTYPQSRFSPSFSSLNGDPFIAVFFSEDSYEKILQFYKEKLNIDYKEIDYGSSSLKVMTIYQFPIEPGPLKNYIAKGVEVLPLNSRNQFVNKAKTKIKIYVPQSEVRKGQKPQSPEN